MQRNTTRPKKRNEAWWAEREARNRGFRSTFFGCLAFSPGLLFLNFSLPGVFSCTCRRKEEEPCCCRKGDGIEAANGRIDGSVGRLSNFVVERYFGSVLGVVARGEIRVHFGRESDD